MNFLELIPLTSSWLSAVVDLDRRCLGGLWTLDAYQRELESPNSDLVGIVHHSQPIALLSPSSEQADVEPSREQSPHSTLIAVGCLWAILEEAHITLIAVDPNYRLQGVGQAILLALLTQAHRRGLEWATLEVRASNHAAIALYQKFGFEAIGQRRRYYQDTGEDALILWLKGLHHPDFPNRLEHWQTQVGDRLRQAGWDWQPPVFDPKGNLP